MVVRVRVVAENIPSKFSWPIDSLAFAVLLDAERNEYMSNQFERSYLYPTKNYAGVFVTFELLDSPAADLLLVKRIHM